jgi:hypothetical protein
MSKYSVIEKGAEASLLCDVYRNAKMGGEAILTLLPKVSDEKLKSELTAQLSRYDEIANEAKQRLEEMGEKPEEERPLSRLMAKMGITMNTVIDKTSSHVAEMIIEGAVMGITDITKRLNEGLDYKDAESLAKKLVDFEADTAERMKEYL